MLMDTEYMKIMTVNVNTSQTIMPHYRILTIPYYSQVMQGPRRAGRTYIRKRTNISYIKTKLAKLVELQ